MNFGVTSLAAPKAASSRVARYSRTARSAYGSEANLAWLVKEREIAPHIPVFDKSNRTDGTFSRADFMFDPDANEYTCPGGKRLVQFRRSYKTPRTGITSAGTRLYRASQHDCKVCELKPQCCPNMPSRDLNEDARDVARAIAETPEYERSRHRRKKVEMLFADLKRILRLGRLRLRGPSGARRVPPRRYRPESQKIGKAPTTGRADDRCHGVKEGQPPLNETLQLARSESRGKSGRIDPTKSHAAVPATTKSTISVTECRFGLRRSASFYSSTCSEIANASSTSIPR